MFQDRSDAGRRLADRLLYLRDQDVVVVGLPRGGVPVAFQIALTLHAPLDVILVRKLGVPFQPELGMGAIAEGGVSVINDQVVRTADVSPFEVASVEAREERELRRAAVLRGGRPQISLDGRTVIIVDDGMATGITARAACAAAKARGADRVILAVPLASPEAVADLSREVEVVCLQIPRDLRAVGQWYRNFTQTSDRGVADLLARAAGDGSAGNGHPVDGGDPVVEVTTGVTIRNGSVDLQGDLCVPYHPVGVVIFAHGSGSSRHSPRNRFVAAQLNRVGLATLLFDLLTPPEETDRRNVFDIEPLAERLGKVTDWVRDDPQLDRLPIGYFGASTGAAAALWAAAQPGANLMSVVSRSGRPDLAASRLRSVRAPTLLIVGGRDTEVLHLNRMAQARLVCENRLAVVPAATHLLEEPGALSLASELATSWFLEHLPDTQTPAA